MARMNNHLNTLLLMAALSALVIGLGAVISPQHLAVFPATALLMNLGTSFVNPLAASQTLSRLFSTHPPIEDRVARLRAIAGQVGLAAA